MKSILVISDVHGSQGNLKVLLQKETFTDVIFSGDGLANVLKLLKQNDANRYFVRGNVDRYFGTDIKDELLCGIYNRLFLITHGDKYGVKGDKSNLHYNGEENYADVVVFGHTHEKYLKEMNGIVLFNPGALIDGNYGMIFVENDDFNFKHRSIF